MGADMYIQSLHKKCYDEWHKEFEFRVSLRDAETDAIRKEQLQESVERAYDKMYAEGYFRDSYNSTNLLWQIGLSWWEDINKLVNKQGFISLRNIRKFKQMIETRPIPEFEMWKSTFDTQYITIDDKDNRLEDWYEYFKEKRENLLKFLQQALDLKEKINCSF